MTEPIAQRYRDFAAHETRGLSPLYEELSGGVAEDPDLLRLLATLPEDKQQPNLLLAATRYVAGLADSGRLTQDQWNDPATSPCSSRFMYAQAPMFFGSSCTQTTGVPSG